jgi:hypothetical protein
VPRSFRWQPWAPPAPMPSMATWPGPAMLTTSLLSVGRRRIAHGRSWPPRSNFLVCPSSRFLRDPPVSCSRHPSILLTATRDRLSTNLTVIIIVEVGEHAWKLEHKNMLQEFNYSMQNAWFFPLKFMCPEMVQFCHVSSPG